MKAGHFGIMVVAFGLMTGCTQGSADNGEANTALKADRKLECAALISAASHLMAQGQIEEDPDFHGRALVSMMTFLNAYAIPKDLREPEAFEALHALRDEFIKNRSAPAIRKQAQTCIDRTPTY